MTRLQPFDTNSRYWSISEVRVIRRRVTGGHCRSFCDDAPLTCARLTRSWSDLRSAASAYVCTQGDTPPVLRPAVCKMTYSTAFLTESDKDAAEIEEDSQFQLSQFLIMSVFFSPLVFARDIIVYNKI